MTATSIEKEIAALRAPVIAGLSVPRLAASGAMSSSPIPLAYFAASFIQRCTSPAAISGLSFTILPTCSATCAL